MADGSCYYSFRSVVCPLLFAILCERFYLIFNIVFVWMCQVIICSFYNSAFEASMIHVTKELFNSFMLRLRVNCISGMGIYDQLTISSFRRMDDARSDRMREILHFYTFNDWKKYTQNETTMKIRSYLLWFSAKRERE